LYFDLDRATHIEDMPEIEGRQPLAFLDAAAVEQATGEAEGPNARRKGAAPQGPEEAAPIFCGEDRGDVCGGAQSQCAASPRLTLDPLSKFTNSAPPVRPKWGPAEQQGVYFDGHEDPARREEGTNGLLDALGAALERADART
jgi:hypothetical protein